MPRKPAKGRADKIKDALLSRKQLAKAKGLSTGSTLLNLACSGDPDYGLLAGQYYYFVGDSASGKSFLTLTCLAEASIDPGFAKYRFIHDDAENGTLMDIGKFFGAEVLRRMEPPSRKGASTTVEEFYFNLDDAFNTGRPFVYILDSMDCIFPEEEAKKFQKVKRASRDQEETTGSYGTAKAKLNSSNLRRAIPRLRETGSILIIISQTRDNVGFGSQYKPKTRAGGKALTFYACIEMWSSIREKVKRRAKGKDRQIGIVARLEVKKNRQNGRLPPVDVPIYWSSGIDDTGSMVRWLVEERAWKREGESGPITVEEWGVSLPEEELVAYVEEAGLEGDLKEIVTRTWREIEEACRVERKSRYS